MSCPWWYTDALEAQRAGEKLLVTVRSRYKRLANFPSLDEGKAKAMCLSKQVEQDALMAEIAVRRIYSDRRHFF